MRTIHAFTSSTVCYSNVHSQHRHTICAWFPKCTAPTWQVENAGFSAQFWRLYHSMLSQQHIQKLYFINYSHLSSSLPKSRFFILAQLFKVSTIYLIISCLAPINKLGRPPTLRSFTHYFQLQNPVSWFHGVLLIMIPSLHSWRIFRFLRWLCCILHSLVLKSFCSSLQFKNQELSKYHSIASCFFSVQAFRHL